MLLEHNKEVFQRMENYLNDKNKSILILGTCLGKTSTALAYVEKYNLKALLLGPNLTITDSWDSYDNIDVMTYQEFANKYLETDFSQYGIVICDEVHHIGAPEWGRGLKYILDNNLCKVLGLTATNIRGDGIDIADELFKGCEAVGLTVLEGIQQGILNGMKYVNAYYDLEEIEEEYSDLDNDVLRKKLDLALNNTATVKEIFTDNMPKGDRKGIIFVSDSDDIELAKNMFLESFPDTEIRVLHSSVDNNDETREWFKTTKTGFIISQNMINEGAHYDGINTLVMLRRTGSSLLYYQQIGRVLSLSKYGDNNAIIFDLVNNNRSVALYNMWKDDVKFKIELERQQNLTEEEEKEFEDSIPKQIIFEDYTNELSDILEEIRINELKCRPWTEEEDEIIKEFYPSEGSDVYVLLNNRSRVSCYKRARSLGLKYICTPWTEEEDSILIANKDKFKDELEILIPNHSWNSIRNRAREQLGFTVYSSEKSLMGNEWSEEEIRSLVDNFDKYGSNIPELLEKHSIKSIYAKAQRLGLKYSKPWTSEEDNILRTYYPELGPECFKKIQNRTEPSCRNRVRLLDLKMNHRSTGDIWTNDEIDVLKEYYPTEGTKVADRLPGRTKETIKRYARINNIKYIIPPGRKVRCIETGEVFNKIKDAEKFCNSSTVGDCCRGKRETAGGYHWEYVDE